MNLTPKWLFVVRHAESLEDIDNMLYARMADKDVPLSEAGRIQSTRFARELVQKLGGTTTVRFHLSPSVRVVEMAHLVASEICEVVHCDLIVQPLIIKQNWGNTTIDNRDQVGVERYSTGVLRYRFPGGESGAELLTRFETFAETLVAEITSGSDSTANLVITHGFEMRVLLKVLFGWTEECFESLSHPKNCEMKTILLKPDGSRSLVEPMRLCDPSSNTNFIRRQNP